MLRRKLIAIALLALCGGCLYGCEKIKRIHVGETQREPWLKASSGTLELRLPALVIEYEGDEEAAPDAEIGGDSGPPAEEPGGP